MRKRFTKIICTAVAAISALSLVGISACSNSNVLSVKDNSAVVAGTNGGFMVETQDYAYFINGVASSSDDNVYGSVLKGSVQRIKKSDVANLDYSKSETVVPSVIYSGSHSTGLYIYDGYIYYSTPATDRNTSGEIQRSKLDFKRTKLDGSDTTRGYIFQSDNNGIEYRYVQPQGAGSDVYLMYVNSSEKLFDESTGVTNVHSVNCTTGVDTLLAYNVAGYAFDTENVENSYVYYTMNVPERLGKSGSRSYNQTFRVKADVTVSPRTLDFTGVEDYDENTNPLYVNLGDFVFDGVGSNDLDRLDQLNFTTELDNGSDLKPGGYTYSIDCYRDGTLYYTRNSGYLFALKDADYNATANWNAVTANGDAEVFLTTPTSITSYKFYEDEASGKTYAITAASNGIRKSEIKDNKIASSTTPDAESYPIDSSASATLLDIREEGEHTNLYFGVSGDNGGNFIKRIALDGTFEKDYHRLDTSVDGADKTYTAVKILDIEYDTGWYAPEFITGTNTLMFASDTLSMSSFTYIMACDLSDKDGNLMDNNELNAYTEQFEAIGKKIDEEYSSDKTYSNGSAMYENLPAALKYVFRTRDAAYMAELIRAYVDIEGRSETYRFTEDSVEKQKQFVEATGDWADYADADKYPVKTVNGEAVRANYSDYYYTVIGRMTDADAEALQNAFKSSMPNYPEDRRTWWEKLSTGAKAGFIIGMIVLGLAVVAGATVLTIYLVRRFKKDNGVETTTKVKAVDITDDKDIDVYGDESEKE